MYVCICNALSESAIHATIGAGARTVRQVCDALAVRPQCGKCLAHIRDMVREARAIPAGAD